jgi:hypothetical protein
MLLRAWRASELPKNGVHIGNLGLIISDSLSDKLAYIQSEQGSFLWRKAFGSILVLK